jgi:hypothetical protein
MANNKQSFGEMDFSDVGGGNRQRDEFMRIENGLNKFRILTKLFQYTSHKVKKTLEDKFASQKVLCSAPVHGTCPLCEMTPEQGVEKAKPRWYIGVLNRKVGKYQILDVNYGVLLGVRQLNNNPDWGDPTKYDIVIDFDRNRPPAQMYQVQGNPNMKPLTAEEQLIRDNALANIDSLKERCVPLDPEKVLERFNKIREATQGDVANALAAAKAGKSPAAAVAADDDEDFPTY